MGAAAWQLSFAPSFVTISFRDWPPPTNERWLPPAFASSARFGRPSDLADPLCHSSIVSGTSFATHRMSTASGEKRAVGLPAVVLVICMKNESH
jgi:hypothetical protein